MIRFTEIEIEWFGSIPKLTYQFHERGLTVIRGENGSGKTCIFSALTWALFGKPIKSGSTITPWPIVIGNKKNTDQYPYKGTRVKVSYIKDGVLREITRCDSYTGKVAGAKGSSRIICEVDGKLNSELRDKKDVQEWIIKDLGYTFQLFKSTRLFGQKLKRIMGEDGPTRTQILEEAFNVSYLTRAKELADKGITEINLELGGLNQKTAVLTVSIANLLDRLTREKAILLNHTEARDKEMARLKQTIDDLMVARKKARADEGNTQELTRKHKKLTEKQKQLDKDSRVKKEKLTQKEFDLSMEVSELKLKREFLEEKISDCKKAYMAVNKKCTFCGAPVKSEVIREQQTNIKGNLNKHKASLSELNIAIDNKIKLHKEASQRLASFKVQDNEVHNIQRRKEKLERAINKAKDAKLLCQSITERIEEKIADLNRVKDTPPPSQELKESLELQYKEAKAARKKLSPKVEALEHKLSLYQFASKTAFSPNGIKAFLFDAQLKATNKELLKYTPIMGFRVTMGLKLDKARKDLYVNVYKTNDGVEQEIPHADLSGGQMQLIDVCIALAIDDSLTSDRDCNLKAFDEVFESLSPVNLDKVGDILALKSNTQDVHVITHTKFNPSGSKLVELTLSKTLVTTARFS